MVGGREGQRFISVCEEWSCYYGVSSSGQTARLSSSGDVVTMLTFVRADSDGLMPGHFFSGDLNVVHMLAEIQLGSVSPAHRYIRGHIAFKRSFGDIFNYVF